MNLSEQISSLKGQTIQDIGGEITDDYMSINFLILTLSDGRKVKLSPFAVEIDTGIGAYSQPVMDIEITS